MTNDEAISYIIRHCNPDYPKGKTEWETAINMAIDALRNLPTQMSGTSEDTISRQAAIDAMCSVCGNDCDKSKFVYNAPQDEQVILCPEHYALSTLPSAQPEIIHCRDCKHYYYTDNRIPQEQRFSCDLDGDRWKPDDSCSYAEGRTDEL